MDRQGIVSTFTTEWRTVGGKGHVPYHLLESEPNITLVSPVVHTPFKDRSKIDHILQWILEIIEGFHYTAVYTNVEELRVAMLFEGRVGKLKVEGIDLFRLNAQGKVVELKVMLRPLSATKQIQQEMGRRLEGLVAKQ